MRQQSLVGFVVSGFARSPRSLFFAAVVTVSAPSAMADILGMAPGSYTYNQVDGGNPAQAIGSTGIQITTGSAGQARSIWFNQRQAISQFSAQFTFRVTGNNGTFNRDAIAFVVQNAPAGANAIGTGMFAYEGLSNSVATTTEVVLRGTPRESFSGVYFNGVVGGGSLPTLPVNAAGGNSIRVSINYDGSLMSILYSDLTTGAIWAPSPTLVGSIASRIGSSDAYVGFTAGVLASDNSEFFISDFSYSVPSPTAASLLGLAGFISTRRRR